LLDWAGLLTSVSISRLGAVKCSARPWPIRSCQCAKRDILSGSEEHMTRS